MNWDTTSNSSPLFGWTIATGNTTVQPGGDVTTVLTSNGWVELKETKESNVRKLYEVFLVNRLDGEVKDYLELATSEADAIMLAVLEAKVSKADLSNWVKKARFVCDVPEASET